MESYESLKAWMVSTEEVAVGIVTTDTDRTLASFIRAVDHRLYAAFQINKELERSGHPAVLKVPSADYEEELAKLMEGVAEGGS